MFGLLVLVDVCLRVALQCGPGYLIDHTRPGDDSVLGCDVCKNRSTGAESRSGADNQALLLCSAVMRNLWPIYFHSIFETEYFTHAFALYFRTEHLPYFN